jgi:hypothetical protein
MTTTIEAPAIVTRRVNRFYIFTGPVALLRAATLDEIRATAKDLKRRRHVNAAIVGAYVDLPESDRLLTVAELRYLSEAGIGVSMDRFLTTLGVTRRYDYQPAPHVAPAGIVRRPAEAR